MVELDFETDQKLKVLSEALRAGPGSPQWREAVSEWQTSSGSEDEHQLLMRVREHLASGKSYREIRAGAGFTRRVMEEIDHEEAKRGIGPTPSAGWIAAISGLVIVGVVGVVAFFVWPRPPGNGAASPDLSRTTFVRTSESATFDDSIGSAWQTFGNLTLVSSQGLRPVTSPRGGATEGFIGGGIYWDHPLGADQPFSIESAIELEKTPPKSVVVQIFITDERTFEGASATTPHELTWTLKDGEGNVVLPDGRVAGTTVRLGDNTPAAKQTMDVRVAVAQNDGVVEVNRQRVFAGQHQLDPKKARTIGVRFLWRGDDGHEHISVQSVRVMEPEAKLPGPGARGAGK